MSTITKVVNHDKQEKTCYPFSGFKAETLKLAEKVGVASERDTRLTRISDLLLRGAVKKDTSTSKREKYLAAEVLAQQTID